jgi:hypothetical protein
MNTHRADQKNTKNGTSGVENLAMGISKAQGIEQEY